MKISSGTVAALLVVSGILFLVPFVAPVHAFNQSPPTFKVTTGSPLLGTEGTWIDVLVTNPATNLYGLTGVTLVVPTGWTLSDCDTSGIIDVCAWSGQAAEFATTSGITLAPGASSTVELYVTAPAPTSPQTYPYTGLFTSSIQDASNLAYYAGPSFQLEVIDPLTAFTFTANPPAVYVAGSGAVTVTVTQTDATTPEAGLTIDWSIFALSGYGSGTYTLTATSVTTISGGVASASATFVGSNHANDEAYIIATVGSSSVLADSSDTTTAAGPPAEVTFLAGANAFPSTWYISGDNVGVGASFGTPSFTGATTMAEVDATNVPIGVTVADHYGNAIAFEDAGVSTITLQALSGAGGWDWTGDTALATSITCTTPVAGAVDCSTGATTLNYFQAYTYATIGKLQATITGTYNAAPYTVGGSSGNIFTSAQALAITAGPIAAVNPVEAGTATPVYANLTASLQPGVPITMGLCVLDGAACAGMTTGYGGSNSGFGNPGGSQLVGGNSAVGKLAGTTSSSFQAMYYVDTVAGSVASFNVTAKDPTNALVTNVLGWATSALVTTGPGAAATFTIVFYYTAKAPASTCTAVQCPLSGNVVAGTTVYPDATLADKYSNVVTNTSPYQIYVALTVSAGTLSTPQATINSGGSDTYSSFGAVAYFTPSSATPGTVLTLTASGNVNGVPVQGSKSLTVVSPIPTFSVTSPTFPSGGVIYTNNAAAVFRGWANVSLGYDPATSTIASIGYSVNGGHWYSASFTPETDVNYAIAAFLNLGLNTVQFNATDNVGPNTFKSQVYQVLVDTTLPVIKFPSTTSVGYGVVLPVTIYDTEGDLNVTANSVGQLTGVTAYAGTVDLNVTTANLVGSNTVGSNSTFTLNLSNIPVGTWTLKVAASNYAGNSAVATETVTVTVAFAESVIYEANSVSWATVGAYSGVLASWTNAWSSSQSLVIYAQLTNSTGSYVLPGSSTISSGATVQVFCPNISFPNLEAGTYTLTMFAVTTANNPVSITTTVNNFAVS